MQLGTEAYNFWSLVVQVVVWVAMIATLAITRRQLKTAQESTIGQNMLSIINILQAPNVRDARTIVRQKLRNKHFSQWTQDERAAADIVCANYDIVSMLIMQQKVAPFEPIIENWGPSIRDCYEILSGYIEHMQTPEFSGPRYWKNFPKLYKESQKHN